MRHLQSRQAEMQTAQQSRGFLPLGFNIILVGSVTGNEGVESFGNCEPEEQEGAADIARTVNHDAGVAARDSVGLSYVVGVDGGKRCHGLSGRPM